MCSGIDRQKSTINGIPLPWDGKSITFGHPQLRKYILKRLDIHSAPGKQFNYTDYNAELLGLILERAIGKSVSAYLEEKIWKPCEMEYPALWLLDSKKSGFEKKSCGLYARPIDYAKYGRLYLNRGTWNGRRVIPEAWVMESTREDIQTDQLNYYPPGWLRNTYYKYHWKGFVNPDATISLSVGGDMGQNIYISPQKNLIIVHCGSYRSQYGVEDLWDIERNIDNPFFDIVYSKGVSAAMAYLESMTQTARISLVSERQLNTVGYGFLYENKLDAAMTVFKHVVEIFPSSSNAYDSLAEAYMKNGQKEMAIKNYEKSLTLNPDNENAKEMINKLKN